MGPNRSFGKGIILECLPEKIDSFLMLEYPEIRNPLGAVYRPTSNNLVSDEIDN